MTSFKILIINVLIFLFLLLASWLTFVVFSSLIVSKINVRRGIPQNDGNQSQEQPKKFKRLLNRYIGSLPRVLIYYTSKIPSHHIRNCIYRKILLMKLARHTSCYYGCEFRAPWFIEIGEGSIIGDQCIIDGRRGVKIGKNVNFSTGVWVWSLQHDYKDYNFGLSNKQGVEIEDFAWIGPRSIILPGVKIGKGSVIGAGSVVTRDIPPFKLAAGVPANVIGDRPEQMNYNLGENKPIPFL